MHIEIKLNIYLGKKGKDQIFFKTKCKKKKKNQDPSIESELNLEI